MRQITAEQFKAHVERDPAWASKLTEPVEITGYCDMEGSKITHLSPLLTFSGRNEGGDVASFWKCKSLKVAEGTFHGFVSFSDSGIERIGELAITKPNNDGFAAFFSSCKSLKVAEGTFHGFVGFSDSGIEKIGNLSITRYDKDGFAASFFECVALKTAPVAWLDDPKYILDDELKSRIRAQINARMALRQQPGMEI